MAEASNLFTVQDGLGDTIRVSLTEPPEEEIDPCRRLANLGMRAAELQQGVVQLHKQICFMNMHRNRTLAIEDCLI